MKTKTRSKTSTSQTFLEHLEELRSRLTWSVVAVVVGGIIGYIIHDPIYRLLIRPLNQPLFYSSPTGGIDFLIKVCVFFGIICATPILIYNLLKFLEPVMPAHMRLKTVSTLLVSTVLMLLGVLFAYFVSLPAALHFLAQMGNDKLHALISANEYLTFVLIYLTGFALLFQLPLIISFINRIKPLKPRGLMKMQRYVIIGSFITAAILTPTPDPFNQAIMAGPIILLYQLSIIMVWFINRNRTNVEPFIYPTVNKSELKPLIVSPTIPLQPERQPVRHTRPTDGFFAAKPLTVRPKNLAGTYFLDLRKTT